MSLEEIKKIIEDSSSKAECNKRIWGYSNGKTSSKLDKLILENNIDISHFGRKRKYDKIEKECPVCQTRFKTLDGHPREKTTCSYSCSNTFFRSGLDNGNWNNDRYRTTCFAFHKKECIICGESKIVGVHHYDENHYNNSPENLVPLCPTHHQYFHSQYRNLVESQIDEYVEKFKKTKQKNILYDDII